MFRSGRSRPLRARAPARSAAMSCGVAGEQAPRGETGGGTRQEVRHAGGGVRSRGFQALGGERHAAAFAQFDDDSAGGLCRLRVARHVRPCRGREGRPGEHQNDGEDATAHGRLHWLQARTTGGALRACGILPEGAITILMSRGLAQQTRSVPSIQGEHHMPSYVAAALVLLVAAAAAEPADDAAPAPAPPPAVPIPACIEHEKGPYLIGPLTREAWTGSRPTWSRRPRPTSRRPTSSTRSPAVDRDLRHRLRAGHLVLRFTPRGAALLEGHGSLRPAAGFPADVRGRPRRRPRGGGVGGEPGHRARLPHPLTVWNSSRRSSSSRPAWKRAASSRRPSVSLEADLAAILGVRATPSWH